MHLLPLLTTTLSILTLTNARIIGIALPSHLTPSSSSTLTLLTQNYIQRISDISLAFGYAPTPGYPQSVGSFVQSSYLGPDKSNIITPIAIPITVPSEDELEQAGMGKDVREAAGGNVTLTAAVWSLLGVVGMPQTVAFRVNVTIGQEESDQVVSSEGWDVWGSEYSSGRSGEL